MGSKKKKKYRGHCANATEINKNNKNGGVKKRMERGGTWHVNCLTNPLSSMIKQEGRGGKEGKNKEGERKICLRTNEKKTCCCGASTTVRQGKKGYKM